jgi:hypothetical protein
MPLELGDCSPEVALDRAVAILHLESHNSPRAHDVGLVVGPF